MTMTKNQEELVRKMARIHAGLFKYVEKVGIKRADLEKMRITWTIVVADKLPATGERRTVYFITRPNKKTGDNYAAYIWAEPENGKASFEQIGNAAHDMQWHYTLKELEDILENYRDVVDAIPHEASFYNDDISFAKLTYNEGATPKSPINIVDKRNSTNFYNPLEITPAELETLYNHKDELVDTVLFNELLDREQDRLEAWLDYFVGPNPLSDFIITK